MENKLSTRAQRFDECLSELSTESQLQLLKSINVLKEQLADGGGVMSAKEILYQLAYTGLYSESHFEKMNRIFRQYKQEQK
jgi:hypothetical protein